MGLYCDKLRKAIIQSDEALDLIDRKRYERHESIGPCTCTKCRKDKTKQTNLVENFKFPDTNNRFKLGEK
jgi:hypothetical protein